VAEAIRVLIAKPGLDGHDRGAKYIARTLRDAGMEVIYSGLRQTPEMITETALQEDVPAITAQLKEKGLDVIVIAGGIIPEDDIPFLKQVGISAVFGPGTPSQGIADYITQAVASEKA